MLIVFLFTVSTSFAQNGTRPADYNARTLGRGGTAIGFFDSPELMMTNPAGLSFITKPVIDINAIMMLPAPSFTNYKKDAFGNTTTNLLNDKNGEKTFYMLPSLAYVHDFKESKFTLGIGGFTTGGMGADFILNHDLFKDALGSYVPMTYHSRYGIFQGGLSLAYAITPQISVGATAHVLYSTLEFTNPFSLVPSILGGVIAPGKTFGDYFRDTLGYSEVTSSANMKGLNAVSFNGKIGIAYKPNEKFSAGMTYSTPVSLGYKNGTSTLDMTAQFKDAFTRAVGYYMLKRGFTQAQSLAYVSGMFSALGIDQSKGFIAQYDITNDFKIPQSVGFGFMFSPTTGLRIGIDMEWINWSNAAKKMSLVLKNGANDNINRLLAAGGVGQSDFNVDFQLQWKDSYLFKIGGEYDFCKCITARIGYIFGSNPIPETTITPIIPAVLEHHITAGASFNLTPNFTINTALELGINNKVYGDNPHLLASEFNNSITQLTNYLAHLSFTYNF
ncbi:hypothetical protein D4R20_02015 [bacterium]|nr:MAG: hypothetical protein D4R20_02015 [bacterium]